MLPSILSRYVCALSYILTIFNKGSTPLHEACKLNDVDLVKTLLSLNASPGAIYNVCVKLRRNFCQCLLFIAFVRVLVLLKSPVGKTLS